MVVAIFVPESTYNTCNHVTLSQDYPTLPSTSEHRSQYQGLRRTVLHKINSAMNAPITQKKKKIPRLGPADAEIKAPSGENTELRRSPFRAWSRSVYSHKCYAYCQGSLPCLFLPFRSIHLHFSQISPEFVCVCVCMCVCVCVCVCVCNLANTGSCVGPQNKIGHPAGYRFSC